MLVNGGQVGVVIVGLDVIDLETGFDRTEADDLPRLGAGLLVQPESVHEGAIGRVEVTDDDLVPPDQHFTMACRDGIAGDDQVVGSGPAHGGLFPGQFVNLAVELFIQKNEFYHNARVVLFSCAQITAGKGQSGWIIFKAGSHPAPGSEGWAPPSAAPEHVIS